jgi:ATP-dependent Lon protease
MTDAIRAAPEAKIEQKFTESEATEKVEAETDKAVAEPDKAVAEPDKAAGEKAEAAVDGAMTDAIRAAPEAKIEQGAVDSLIRWYCREAGVRNLQKHIEKICRKLAMRVVERRERLETDKGESTTEKSADAELVVTEEGLSDLVGKPAFTSDRLYEGPLPAGTVTGLAWTSMGGSVLYMEATALPRLQEKSVAPSLGVTGQLGNVMKESSQLALLLARRQLSALAPPERRDFFEKHELHLHCPEGATPKDGPSAGITMVTALLSLGLDTPVRADLAMTGEVSLNGKVLGIGGVKEKTIAARRAGCKALVFPQTNRRDFEELPAYLKDGLEVHYATDYSDVFTVAFPDYHAAKPADVGTS